MLPKRSDLSLVIGSSPRSGSLLGLVGLSVAGSIAFATALGCSSPDSGGSNTMIPGFNSPGGNGAGVGAGNGNGLGQGGVGTVDTSGNGGTGVIGVGGNGMVVGASGATGIGGGGAATSPPIIDPITGMVIPPDVARGGCAVVPGMISDFEEQQAVVSNQLGWTGGWETFSGAGLGPALTVEPTGGAACDANALHVQGTGFAGFVGVGINLLGTNAMPTPYDASQFNAIRFRARLGTGQTPSPVRFNIVTPATEGISNFGGECVDALAAGIRCFQHVGRFLDQEQALSTEWRDYTFCFDRDLYPLSLPSYLSNAQRDTVASNILKLQFQFNKAKNPAGQRVNNALPEYDATLPFDFFLDNLQFDTAAACAPVVSPSNGTPASPFPLNNGDGCITPTGVEKFSATIATIYDRWKRTFVVPAGTGMRVNTPEQNNITTSEGMGYGMLLAASMGDRATFDAFWAYVQTQITGGLMQWMPGAGSSATDGDIDIAYGLFMADGQWPGSYATQAASMAGAIAASDTTGNRLKPGSAFNTAGAYNPSYFAPRFFRAFPGFAAQIDGNHAALTTCTAGLPADWCNATSGPARAADVGAQVTSAASNLAFPVYAFDATRVPWRVGIDACVGGGNAQAQSYVSGLVGIFTGLGELRDTAGVAGARIDLMVDAYNLGGTRQSTIENQASFIGPLGVGAQGIGNRAVMERAFRAVLDILDNPEFNQTYFPSTLGLITLLQMSGNFLHVD